MSAPTQNVDPMREELVSLRRSARDAKRAMRDGARKCILDMASGFMLITWTIRPELMHGPRYFRDILEQDESPDLAIHQVMDLLEGLEVSYTSEQRFRLKPIGDAKFMTRDVRFQLSRIIGKRYGNPHKPSKWFKFLEYDKRQQLFDDY